MAFFFAVSGFFFLRAADLAHTPFRKSLYRLTLLYLAWSLIYLPARIMEYTTDGLPFYMDLLLYLRDFVFGYYHLWFFAALLQILLLLWLLRRFFSLKTLLIFSLLLHIGAVILGSYLTDSGSLGWYYNAFLRNGPMLGLFYFTLGMYIQVTPVSLPARYLAAGLLISLIGLSMESFYFYYQLHHSGIDMYLCNIPLLFFMLSLLARKNKIPEGAAKYAHTLRKSSILIYGIHMWFLYICLTTSLNPILNDIFQNGTVHTAIFCFVSAASCLSCFINGHM